MGKLINLLVFFMNKFIVNFLFNVNFAYFEFSHQNGDASLEATGSQISCLKILKKVKTVKFLVTFKLMTCKSTKLLVIKGC